MPINEMTIWIARFTVLGLMYLYLIVLVFALFADARAATSPIRVGRRQPEGGADREALPVPIVVPASALRLIVVSGTIPPGGPEYTIVAPFEIGRGDDCDLTITNRFVSSRHVRLSPHDGGWVVEDLGSTNGTLLNHEPVIGARTLQRGDLLMVGDTEFRVQ